MFESVVRSFLYHPLRIPRDAPVPGYIEGAEEVWINSEDGETVHGLFWPAPSGRPTILFFHGNAQSGFEWALIRDEFAPMDCGMLLIDYPGYGKSSGSPREESLYAAGRSSLNWLVTEAGIPEASVVVFGKSLGGPVAVETIIGRKVRGLVLESTFRSVPHVAKRLLPMVPAGSVLRSERYETYLRIESVKTPLLVIHGEVDEIIPPEEGRSLFELAPEPKELYMVPGAGHNDVSMILGSAYGKFLRQWLDNSTSSDGG